MSRTVAILGGGQLAQMLGEAAKPLGVRCRALDPSQDACAGSTCELIRGDFEDPRVFEALIRDASVLTFEFENVPAGPLREAMKRGLDVRPGANALEAASDRLVEKQLFESVGMRVPPFEAVSSAEDLIRAIDRIGTPLLLKARSGGYDGRGQARIDGFDDPGEAWSAIGRVPCLAERRVQLLGEISVVACRSVTGETVTYPIAANEHRGGILVRSIAPAAISPEMAEQALAWTRSLLAELDYVGVLALELFITAEGLMANEFAPRVHNTGHWTIEGASTSQFENHMRAILDMPLGPTDAIGYSVMRNLIGTVPSSDDLIEREGVSWHLYGKTPRPGRKLGHVTFSAPSREAAELSEAAVLKK